MSRGRGHRRGAAAVQPNASPALSACELINGCFFFPLRSWQAESVDSGCSNSTAFAGACSEGLCGEGTCLTTGGRCDRSVGKLSTIKVGKSAALI